MHKELVCIKLKCIKYTANIDSIEFDSTKYKCFTSEWSTKDIAFKQINSNMDQ